MKKHRISLILQASLFSLSVFLLFFIAGISYRQIKALNESEKSVTRVKDIHVELQQLLSGIETVAATQRGFLLTGDSTYLAYYSKAPKEVHHSLAVLRSLLVGNTEQQKNLDTLNLLIKTKFYYLTIEIEQKGSSNPSLLISQMKEGTAAMNRIRQMILKMVSIEKNMLKIKGEEHQHDVKLTPLTMLFLIFFSLIIFLFSFYKIDNDRRYLKKINNQLLITHETFEHAEQIAEISNWCWNIEANVLAYSNNQYRLLGCEPHEFEPTLEKFLEFVHPDDRSIVTEGTQRILLENAPFSIAYFRVIRKDGAIRYFKSLGKMIVDTYGKKILIGINADITDQYWKDKMLEEKLLDLERTNKELSAFNHVASHDLQEPLRKIQTFISRIQEKDFHALSEKGKEYFFRIQIASGRMKSLIDDLLMFSSANKVDKIFEWTDLNIVLEDSKQELAQLIEEKNASIESMPLPFLSVIPFQIQQLFINIIGNSLKYSRPNIPPLIKIQVEIILGKEVPDSVLEADRKYYKISISDNGIGFEQQYSDSIFTLFHRLHDNNSYQGTGIGLAICKKIVENHQGAIKAEGILNVGSAFYIFLPF